MNSRSIARWLIAFALSSPLAAYAEDRVIADFEGKDYAGWKVEGAAFGTAPAHGALPGQMAVEGYQGKGLVNSFTGGDDATGKLTSPPFVVEKPFINFLIGGGAHPDKACINLKIGEQIVRTMTGPNESSGGSERLEWSGWEVKEFNGKTAVIEIVDQVKGGWGHINVDQIVQSDASKITAPKERHFTAYQRYLILPVKTGASKNRVQVLVDGKVVQDFDIELADGRPDFWVACDVGAWSGKDLTVRAGKLPEDSTVLDRLWLSSEKPATDNGRRPEIHFTAPRGWLNDPNGLVYHKGTWHLFYQHNPYGWNWGNMHWGHATSTDLLHWTNQPIALTPLKYGDMAFSGSAVVDTANTSGWGTKDSPPLVAAYTSTGRGECLVYSTDDGQTWNEFDGNPVVKHQGRDPRLLWHADSKQWVMAVYDESENKQWIVFHTSPDLKKWTYQSRIDGYFECPDIFELPVEGAGDESKWVLYGANGEYALGSFDGKAFKPDGPKQRLWYGNFYAAQSFSNAPDGRRIQIGWGQGIEFPDQPFNQQMTLPVELKLKKFDGVLKMTATPVQELAVRNGVVFRDQEISETQVIPFDRNRLPIERSMPIGVSLSCADPGAGSLRLEVLGEPVLIDFVKKTIKVCDAPPAPWSPTSGSDPKVFSARLIVDRGSVEAFIGDGRTAVSARAKPEADAPIVVLTRDGDPIHVEVQAGEIPDETHDH